MSEENRELTTEEMKEKLEKAEKELEKTAKLFNPKELAARNRQLFEKTDPHFGKILYGKITMEELDWINKELEDLGQKNNNTLRTIMMLWKMLQKGCPELTLEDVRNDYGFDDVSELVSLLMSGDFFRLSKPTKS
jgi:ketopantoate reductase